MNKPTKQIVILGGSGFVGGHLCQRLANDGHRITVLSRPGSQCRDIALIPNTRVRVTDVYDKKALTAIFEQHDLVINLVGILNERGFSGKGFQRAHVELTQTVIDAMQQSGRQRYLHMSALGAGKGKSHYLNSRGQAEALLEKAAHQGLQTTIFQPSVIFGRGDSFINRFAQLLKIAPILPLACPNSRFQPVWVGDVVSALAMAVSDETLIGKTLELGGPNIYTLKQLVKYTCDLLGLRRWIIGLPGPLSWLQGQLMDFVPGKPFSSDNYKSLQLDSVCEHNALPDLGIQPTALENQAPDYLLGSRKRRSFQHYQSTARRD